MSRPVTATYRLQLRPGFGFAECEVIVPYLADLGVSHLYLSPIFEAVPGSEHGYDQVDPSRIRDELGGAEGFDSLVQAAHGAELGIVIDIVPHHMATSPANRWWWDVLARGESSAHAHHFDIDWSPPESRLAGKVLLPVLGDHYGRVLERGELQLERSGTVEVIVRYYDNIAPLRDECIGELLEEAGQRGRSHLLVFAGRGLQQLGPADARVAKALASTEISHDRYLEAVYDAVVAEVNSDIDRLDVMLERQHHRFSRWQSGSQQLDYRRFFDIDSLVALRADREDVFELTHSLALRLVEAGSVDGLRVDHVDGLRDPEAYCGRLREGAPGAWIIAEKILRPEEPLPPSWPIDGTTGYDFMTLAGGLLVDPAGWAQLVEGYQRFTGDERSFADVALEARREALHQLLAADLERVVELLVQVCEARRRWRDYTRAELRDALAEVAVHVDAYRSYVREGQPAPPESVTLITDAIDAAGKSRPDLDGELLDALRTVLLGREPGTDAAAVVARFQQLTGPLAAKGEEDTAFYRWLPFIAANEVGGDPARPARSPTDFHDARQRVQQRWPATMLAGSTHDTKRSEDVRARIAVLSERPELFLDAIARWTSIADRHRDAALGAPEPAVEWFVYQTLVGAHPIPAERLHDVVLKSMREAKQRTSWVRQDTEYEEAVLRFLDGLLGDDELLADLDAVVEEVCEAGRVGSLALVALRTLAPGVPDTYQGTEVWDDSLVDPDNRRPVDYAARRALLADVAARPLDELWARDRGGGEAKLGLLHRCLELRKQRPGAFGPSGAYEPLAVSGPAEAASRVVAFARGGEVAAAIPVRCAGGAPDGAKVALPHGRWRSALVDDLVVDGAAPVPLATLRGGFPLAILTRDD